METVTLAPSNPLHLFVTNIWIYEEDSDTGSTTLPFFADGYPGLIYQSLGDGLVVQPQDKQMPLAFLYGQTLHPVELHVRHPFKLVIFQLYPFVLNRFFGLDSRQLNNGCYDLREAKGWNACAERLRAEPDTSAEVYHIGRFLLGLFQNKKEQLDATVNAALQHILDTKARVTIKELCDKLHLSERTLGRRFLKEVGIPPRDFIQIIRFQQSLKQLSDGEYEKFTDIVYTNGFADQSHFIRVFKAFTGSTPAAFVKA